MVEQVWGVAVNGLDAHVTKGPFSPYSGCLLISEGGAIVPASHANLTRDTAEAHVIEHLEMALAWHEGEAARIQLRLAGLQRINLDVEQGL